MTTKEVRNRRKWITRYKAIIEHSKLPNVNYLDIEVAHKRLSELEEKEKENKNLKK